MILPPFAAPRAKVANADEHIRRAATAFDAYRIANPMAISERPAPQGAMAFSFVPTGEFPATVPLAVGDAIHNLRSALDYLAGEVVSLSGGNPKGVYFPFAGKAEDLETQIKDKKFNRAKPEAVELLRSLKPYKEGNDLLRAIHDLDVTDKHQFILPTSHGAIVPSLKSAGMTLIQCTVGGNSNADFVFPKGRVEIEGPVLATLRFSYDGPHAGWPVFETLEKCRDLVSGTIEAFEALCVR